MARTGKHFATNRNCAAWCCASPGETYFSRHAEIERRTEGLAVVRCGGCRLLPRSAARPARQGRPPRKHPLLEIAASSRARQLTFTVGVIYGTFGMRQVVAGESRSAAQARRSILSRLRRSDSRRDGGSACSRHLRLRCPGLAESLDLDLAATLTGAAIQDRKRKTKSSPRHRPIRAMAARQAQRAEYRTRSGTASMRWRTRPGIVLVSAMILARHRRFMGESAKSTCSRAESRPRRPIRPASTRTKCWPLRPCLRAPDRTDMTQEQEVISRSSRGGPGPRGRVISVRLALFAEMVKGKPWTPATLKEVGGTEGIGISFLEETFTSKAASHRHAASNSGR